MQDEAFKQIENIFRRSSSPEELFDTFREALKIPIKDIDAYKILLSNPALSCDEIKLYTEKLVEQFPHDSFETLLWTGKIIESKKATTEMLEDSIKYYKRAFNQNPVHEQPLIHLINLYRNEYFLFDNVPLLDFIESSVAAVNKKSKIYFLLAEVYKQKGNAKKADQYLLLGQKSAERES